MSTFLVKNTGTLSSGASTITGNDLIDWVDSNCRPHSATQAIITAMAADDIIKHDDDTFDFALAVNDQSNAVNGGTLNWQTRSSDYDLCVFRITGNNRCLQFNDTTNVKNWNVSGMQITCATNLNSFTGGAYAVLIGLQTGDVTFSNFAVKNITSNAAIAASTGHLINSSGDTRTITFTDYEFSGNDTGNSNEHGGMVRTNTGDTLVTSNGLITLNTISSSAGNTNGFFHVNGDLTSSNDVLSSNAVSTVAAGVCYALINCQGNNTVNIKSPTITNNTLSGGSIHGFGVFCEGTWQVDDLVAHSNSYTSVDNCLGGAMVSYGATSNGTYNRPHVYNNTVFHGAGFYNSQGGSGTVNSPWFHNNTSTGREGVESGGGGGLYSGGWGDLTVNGGLIYGNIADEGGGVYLHLHNTLATRNKVVTLNNVSILDNVITNTDIGASGGKGIDAENGSATYSLTININNSIIMGNTNSGTGTTHQIDITATGAGGTALNMDYIHIEGTAAVEAPATGGNLTVNTTNEITTTPTFEYDPVTGTTYRPANGSSAQGAGKYISACLMLEGANGEPFPAFGVDIGGIQSTHGPFHPVNL